MVSSFFYITKNTLYPSQNNSYFPILYRKLTFFMRFRKRIDSFSDFECKKMGRTFSRIPFLYFMEEDYFFQVTDLQPFKP